MKNRDQEQEYAIQCLREELAVHGKALLVAGTGWGKGNAIKMISQTMKGTMLTIVPRVSLVPDLAGRTGGSMYCASLGVKEVGRITVATKQSLKDISADLIILDEAHTYKEEFILKLKCKFLVGMTATPYTANGPIHGLDKFWNKPCYNFSIAKGIAAGFNCDYKIYGSKLAFKIGRERKREYTEKEVSEIIKTQKVEDQVEEIIDVCKKFDRKKVVLLCASIDHAEKVKLEVEKVEECLIVHSKLKSANNIIEEYKTNNIRFAVSVMMLSIGTDIPPIDGVIYLRPTRSTSLMQQSSGRGLRLYGDKWCLFMDYAHVFGSCGTPLNPIIPDSQGKKDLKAAENVKQCEACHYIWDDKNSKCPDCGHENKKEIDREKNLNRSALEDCESVIVTRDNIYRQGKAKNGQNFLTIKADSKYFTVFAWETRKFYSELKHTGYVTINYVDQKGKMPKILSFQRLLLT